MKTRIGRLLTAAAAALVMAVSPFAGVKTSVAFTYVPVAGTQTTFNKYLVLDDSAQVPNVTFDFTIAAGDEVPSSNGTMAVLPGIVVKNGDVVTAPKVTSATFAPTDSPVSYADWSDTNQTYHTSDVSAEKMNGTAVLTTGEKYAKKQATVDFTGVTFPEPGIYRYVVSETAGNATGIGYTTDKLIIDVYVTDYVDTDGIHKLQIENVGEKAPYVISRITSGSTPSEIRTGTDLGSGDNYKNGVEKATGLTNTYTTHNLVVGKAVSGNQASRDKYFALTVKVENLNARDKFTVSIADDSNTATVDGNADPTSGINPATKDAYQNKENVQLITVANDATSFEQTYYLQHGQYIAIRGLPDGAKYTVTEDAEDYKSTEKIADTLSTLDWDPDHDGNDAFNDALSSDNMTKDIYTGFTNTRNGTVPTGIVLSVVPAVIIFALALAALIVIAVRRKRAE
ncbi:MAG: hypothetical protein J6M90_05750 [Oscillospiraceae bacterium]|nr:hypothetical protein [Oscillospiraceae bacterium]